MAERQLKTLTIRPANEDEREAIRYVMRESGCRRAAQAMIFACNAYKLHNERTKSMMSKAKVRYNEQFKSQQRLINTLMAENERLRKSLKKIQECSAVMQQTLKELQNMDLSSSTQLPVPSSKEESGNT